MKNSQKGSVVVLLAVGVVAILAVSIYYFQSIKNSDQLNSSQTQSHNLPNATTTGVTSVTATSTVVITKDTINPLCVSTLDGEPAIPYNVNVKECNAKNKQYAMSVNEYSDGFIMVNNPPYYMDPTISTGFTEYELFTAPNGTKVFSVVESGGGSGIFTSIIIAKQSGDILRITDDIPGGDRCNGGTQVEHVDANFIYYTQNVTPPDIVNLTASTTLQPYKDLEASAASCYGLSYYKYNMSTKQTTLISLSFPEQDKADEQSDWIKEYTYQQCFNKIYNSYIDQKKTDLSPSEISTFNQTFLSTCVK